MLHAAVAAGLSLSSLQALQASGRALADDYESGTQLETHPESASARAGCAGTDAPSTRGLGQSQTLADAQAQAQPQDEETSTAASGGGSSCSGSSAGPFGSLASSSSTSSTRSTVSLGSLGSHGSPAGPQVVGASLKGRSTTSSQGQPAGRPGSGGPRGPGAGEKSPQQQKRSVRDLLGQFEAHSQSSQSTQSGSRAFARSKAPVSKSLSQPVTNSYSSSSSSSYTNTNGNKTGNYSVANGYSYNRSHGTTTKDTNYAHNPKKGFGNGTSDTSDNGGGIKNYASNVSRTYSTDGSDISKNYTSRGYSNNTDNRDTVVSKNYTNNVSRTYSNNTDGSDIRDGGGSKNYTSNISRSYSNNTDSSDIGGSSKNYTSTSNASRSYSNNTDSSRSSFLNSIISSASRASGGKSNGDGANFKSSNSSRSSPSLVGGADVNRRSSLTDSVSAAAGGLVHSNSSSNISNSLKDTVQNGSRGSTSSLDCGSTSTNGNSSPAEWRSANNGNARVKEQNNHSANSVLNFVNSRVKEQSFPDSGRRKEGSSNHGANISSGRVKEGSTNNSGSPSSGRVNEGSANNAVNISSPCVQEQSSANNGASGRGKQEEDIPSIVAQLPEDDPVVETRRTTSKWDPSSLVASLYSVPEPLRDKPRPKDRVNIEGFLERLPSGRKKATFWNAWKRSYFRAKDGFLYCYASKHSEKPVMVTQLMGGTVESFESIIITAQDRNPSMVPMLGIDDRMGHYLVVRAGTAEETERWMLALRTHTVEDFCSTYVQPWPVPRAPALLRDSIVIDLGSCSVRAGVLCTQPSLPQLFFPAVCATRRPSGDRVYGPQALMPRVRAAATLSHPIRPTDKINKHTVDLAAVSGLVEVVFRTLGVDPRDYGVVLSVPRALDAATQGRLVADLFDRHGVRSVVLSHQSVLALYAYNASSGVVVDIGERTDIVPIMDGYIVEGGVSRVPYGGEQVVGHVRRLLLQSAPAPPLSMSTVAEALLPRLALERLCFVSPDYRADLRRAQRDPGDLSALVSVREFFPGERDPAMESLSLDAGRFQAPEGLFHPRAWGVDNSGVHKMVHKAIQECSMDARKTMARSVFLAGGLTMLPGFPERLREELAALLPAAVCPKVHASPYRYHAAYIGACVLANSAGVNEMRLTKDEWTRDGGRLLRPWIL